MAATMLVDEGSGGAGARATGALFTAIGAGNLRAYIQGTDDVGHAALAN